MPDDWINTILCFWIGVGIYAGISLLEEKKEPK